MTERAYQSILSAYPDVMDITDVSDALHVSTKTCYKLLHEEKLRGIRVGRAYRIPKIHVIQYLLSTAEIAL